jgi:alkylated DNA nucleotide flippase Atl1
LDVNEATLRVILEGSKQYLVPLYQRPYAWKQNNWTKIWEDLTGLALDRRIQPESSHFTGTLVLDASSVTTGLTQFLVVDGQQRLTTLSVLLAAIASHYESLGNSGDAEKIREQVLINKYADSDDQRYRLRPANFDEPVFRSVVEGRVEKSSLSRIDDAFAYFQKKLSGLADQGLTVKDIEDAALQGLKFVAITAKRDDNVYRIFESINNTGIDLTQADLIRNLVFMKLESKSEQVHNQIWLPLQRDLSGEDIENLFWMDAQWRNPEVRKLDTYEVQKKHILSLDESSLIEFLRNALAIADAIRKVRLIEPDLNPAIMKTLKRLDSLQLPGAMVLITRIVYLRNNKSLSEQAALDSLRTVESYLVRRAIANIPIASLGRIAAAGAADLKGSQSGDVHAYLSSGRRRFPTNDEILRVIQTAPMYERGRKQTLKLILTWLLEDQQGKDQVDFSSMSIEHVLPQKPSEAVWKEFSPLVSDGSDEVELYDELVHNLGNLTLTNYNGELSNKPFSQKREAWLKTTAVIGTQLIASERVWGPCEIRSRGEQLAKRAIEIWPGPDESLLGNESLGSGDLVDEVTSVIPPGRWTSYGDIAIVLGSSGQAVGQRVMKHSPNAWRVLRANGQVAPGFTWPSGSPFEGREPKSVLEEEGVEFDSRGFASKKHRMGPNDLRLRLGEDIESE